MPLVVDGCLLRALTQHQQGEGARAEQFARHSMGEGHFLIRNRSGRLRQQVSSIEGLL